MPARPNILFICTDQQTASAMSCAGNPHLHTPAMDSLAEQGVRFTHARCAQPLCNPARASFFTGRYPHNAGPTGNNERVREELIPQSLGRVMGDAGYACGYAGKWHVPHGKPDPEFGFESLVGMIDPQVVPAVSGFWDRCESESPDKPWFAVASFDNPHNICEWARRQPLPWGEVPEPHGVKNCPPLPANHMGLAEEPIAFASEKISSPGIYPTEGWTTEMWRRYRYAYFRLCEKVDAEIGKLLDNLRQRGGLDNTMIVFTSDHGDGIGEHRWNQKTCLYEVVVRVPMIVRPPGGREPSTSDTLVNNSIDLMPTILDYAGVDTPEGMAGRSVRPAVEGDADAGPENVFLQTRFWSAHSHSTLGRAVVGRKWKYVVYQWGAHREQLFDLESDPGEMVNLVDFHGAREVLSERRRTLRQWADDTGDHFARFIPAPESPAV
ncbi:MAG: sulfatase [Phycisphaeraceae bacterium]